MWLPMKKDDLYRYCIQFPGKSEAEKRAGDFLEMLGRRKSTVIIAALNEYLDHHPEIGAANVDHRVSISTVSMGQVEAKIRELIEEKLAGLQVVGTSDSVPVSNHIDEVSQDIIDMIGDLELFQF